MWEILRPVRPVLDCVYSVFFVRDFPVENIFLFFWRAHGIFLSSMSVFSTAFSGVEHLVILLSSHCHACILYCHSLSTRCHTEGKWIPQATWEKPDYWTYNAFICLSPEKKLGTGVSSQYCNGAPGRASSFDVTLPHSLLSWACWELPTGFWSPRKGHRVSNCC